MCIITSLAVGTALGVSSGIASAIAVASNVALAVGAIGTVAGTALGVVGSYQQGKATEAQYNYQAQVNRQNAEIAKDNAAMERQTGLEEARRQRIATLQAIGEQRVGLAANGVDVNYGSSLDIIEDTAALGELDALMLQTEAERRAINYEIQANNFTNQANMDSFAAINARRAGTMNAWGAAAEGIGKIGLQVGSSFMGGGLGSIGKLGKTGTKMSGGFDISNKGLVTGGSLFA